MKLTEHLADIIRLRVGHEINVKSLILESDPRLPYAILAEKIAITLHAKLAGLKKERVQVDINERWPADWWQAFKARFFPTWALKRFPVRWKTLSVHVDEPIYAAVCPHLDLSAQPRHLRWLQSHEPGGKGPEVEAIIERHLAEIIQEYDKLSKHEALDDLERRFWDVVAECMK